MTSEQEFLSDWSESADSGADSQSLYSAYQRWVRSPFNNIEATMATKPFDTDAWLTRLLFANAGGEQSGSASRKVGQHGLRHWVKRFIARCGFKHRSDFAQVGLTAGGKGEHQVAKNLLGDVENV